LADFDTIHKQLQDWTNKIPLVILGSGASVPFNLPSMWSLGEFLKENISFENTDDAAQFKHFKTTLDRLGDLEAVLHEVQLRSNITAEIVAKTWELVNKSDLDAYDDLLIKKADFPLERLVKHLLYAAGSKLSIITTNYDRLAEYAASFANAFICNGFAPNYIGHFSQRIHQNNISSLRGFDGQVNIWKVHGSLDWFKTDQEEHVQLPLRHSIPNKYKPSIVTPGASKYFETQLEPFRTIFTQADTEIENAKGYLCIGYGFNDIHVQPKLITQIKKNKPIIVITHTLTPKTKEAIIGSKCKNYILVEHANDEDTRIYSSSFEGELIVPGESYWSLGEYYKLIAN